MTPEASLGSALTARHDSDEALVARAWAGDDDALSVLLRRYRHVVRLRARSYFLVGADREDVVQEGMIGLYKAVRDYDPARQSSFSAFAELCITRQIVTAVKTATRLKHAPLNSYVPLHLPEERAEGGGHELAEQLLAGGDDPADLVVSSHELARIERWFAEILSELEAAVLQRYVQGQTYQEMAAELQRHTKSIDNALQRIKRKLETYLRTRDLDEAV
ncbi:MAG: RNA polymerase sporulation sigma factor SigH [Actinomycetota bacterium]|nr:RNA polymerase sporulation sigma factor SigH [Actinomycetota bacterium]